MHSSPTVITYQGSEKIHNVELTFQPYEEIVTVCSYKKMASHDGLLTILKCIFCCLHMCHCYLKISLRDVSRNKLGNV